MDLESKRSLINLRVLMLCQLFGKRVTDDNLEAFRRVYADALQGFTADAISKGFTKAERECERFPTPKIMTHLCGEFMPPQTWRYHYKEMPDVDPQFNTPITVRIDPETGEKLYRAIDCPEGRGFLACLRHLAGRDEKGEKKPRFPHLIGKGIKYGNVPTGKPENKP